MTPRFETHRGRDARQKMLDAVEKATRGHVGMYNGFGQYMGACSCGLECTAVELIDHLDDIIGRAASQSAGPLGPEEAS